MRKFGKTELSSITTKPIYYYNLGIVLLFEVGRTRITRHIKKFFGKLELSEKSIVRKTHFPFSDKDITIYNLEVVIAIGYCVNRIP